MLLSIRPILPVLASVAILMLADGALSTTIGWRMTNAGASSVAVRAVTAAFFAGLIFGSFQCFRFIRGGRTLPLCDPWQGIHAPSNALVVKTPYCELKGPSFACSALPRRSG